MNNCYNNKLPFSGNKEYNEKIIKHHKYFKSSGTKVTSGSKGASKSFQLRRRTGKRIKWGMNVCYSNMYI